VSDHDSVRQESCSREHNSSLYLAEYRRMVDHVLNAADSVHPWDESELEELYRREMSPLLDEPNDPPCFLDHQIRTVFGRSLGAEGIIVHGTLRMLCGPNDSCETSILELATLSQLPDTDTNQALRKLDELKVIRWDPRAKSAGTSCEGEPLERVTLLDVSLAAVGYLVAQYMRAWDARVKPTS
jgi:hypothetical protein